MEFDSPNVLSLFTLYNDIFGKINTITKVERNECQKTISDSKYEFHFLTNQGNMNINLSKFKMCKYSIHLILIEIV